MDETSRHAFVGSGVTDLLEAPRAAGRASSSRYLPRHIYIMLDLARGTRQKSGLFQACR
jgi:hypothetical protein